MMANPVVRKQSSKHTGSAIHFAVFFVLFYLYVWLWVDPSLLYDSAGMVQLPVFSWGLPFFQGFLGYPGGLIEYFSALLSQFYYYAWAGALIITAIAALLTWVTNGIMTALAGRRIQVVGFIPAILILVLCNQYGHKLAVLMAMLVAMLAVCTYMQTARRRAVVRLLTFLALAVPLYYLAGGAYLLYAAICGIFELRTKPGRLLGLCYLLSAEVIPFAFGTYVFDLSRVDLYARLLPGHPVIPVQGQLTVLGLYLFLLVAVLWLAVAGARGQRIAAGSPPPTQTTKSSRLASWRNLTAQSGFKLTLLLVAAAVAISLSFDSSTRILFRMNRFAGAEMWPQVLREARGLPRHRYDWRVVHLINRALYETGRLPYEMFSYPQPHLDFMPNWGLLSKRVYPVVRRMIPLRVETVETVDRSYLELYHPRMLSFFELGDLSLQLGMVNAAQHEAYEALELLGDYPLILKRLALVHIVKGEPETAKLFLRALTRCIHYRGWAQNALQRLAADPLWSTDPQIQHIRSLMILSESVIFMQNVPLDDRFDELLRRNRHNRMAFEYKMAFHLLNRRLQKFASELGRWEDFNYPDIPRHYQEAAVIYESISGQKVDLPGQQISPQTRQAFGEFCETLAPLFDLGDKQRAHELLQQRFGGTYFFYYFFGE